jgi:hypothetical protein
MLLEEGLLTTSQLREALRAQRGMAHHRPLGQILVDQQLITTDQLHATLKKYQRRYLLGDLLVESNVITEDQLQIALQHQKQTRTRLGDVLLALKFLTEEQLKRALCEQLEATFVDLDQVVVDPGAVGLMNRSYAERHRVIPIARTGDRLTLAVDDPADVALLGEVAASTGCRIEVLSSTRAAFDRAFVRAYGDGTPTALSGTRRDALPVEPALRQDSQTDSAPGTGAAPRGVGTDVPPTPRGHTPGITDVQGAAAGSLAAPGAIGRAAGPGDRELTDLRQQLANATQALADLRTAYATLREQEAASAEALRGLEERHRAVLRDQQAAAEEVTTILRRLDTGPSPCSA